MAPKYNRTDHYYRLAKESGYRSRAAYKLIELNKKFRFLSKGASILDLGSWPGSWLQVASEEVGEKGIVIGLDLTPIEPISATNVHTFVGDILEKESLDTALMMNNGEKFTAVISDMAPKLSGIPEVDRARSKVLAESAFTSALQVLRPDGTFVVKLFQSPDSDKLAKTFMQSFKRSSRVVLDTTRKSSTEWYFVGQLSK